MPHPPDRGCKHSKKCIDCPLEVCEKEIRSEKFKEGK
jgi:hypothetical protein